MKKLLFRGILLFIIIVGSEACHYKPFIGYLTNQEGFKKFSKKEQIAGNNSNPQRDYKVNKYDWTLRVFPEKKSIRGKMVIHFTPLSNQNTFLFDLQRKMKIKEYLCSLSGAKIERKGDLLTLILPDESNTGERITLKIVYEGKPANVLNEGPIQWKEDQKGRPWISTVTEGIGPQFIMPCNALLRAEPDSVSISITVPESLKVSANGRLKKVQHNDLNKTKTYIHKVTSPINIYNISFNIGHFVEFTKPYVDINGVERKLFFNVLDYNLTIADSFYSQTPRIMEEFEKMFGEYPFWNDGCKFIESTFSAMEHQSGIAMGSNYRNNRRDYNGTLVHELSHEWWGNSVTGRDYCDIWLHEGMATFSEALFLEKVYGKELYDWSINNFSRRVSNTIPVHKQCDVLYNSWVHSTDLDIYNKGALILHSLRQLVGNDSLFLKSIYALQKHFSGQNISTDQFVLKLNELLGENYSEFFNWYLYESRPPVLKVYVSKIKGVYQYKWHRNVPFYSDGIITLRHGEDLLELKPTAAIQSFSLTDGQLPKFLFGNSIYYKVEFIY